MTPNRTVFVIDDGASVRVSDNDLWDAIRLACDKEEVAWAAHQQRREILDRVATLTTEERRVAELVIESPSDVQPLFEERGQSLVPLNRV